MKSKGIWRISEDCARKCIPSSVNMSDFFRYSDITQYTKPKKLAKGCPPPV